MPCCRLRPAALALVALLAAPRAALAVTGDGVRDEVARDDLAPAPTEEAAPAFGTATEILLPGYQATALDRDLPAREVRWADPQTLMILGQSSLWQWHLKDRTLKRMTLRQSDEDAPLAHLATDGRSWFAASQTALYQVLWDQGRVFRYALPAKDGEVLGFAGSGDDFWLVHTMGLLRFDRYGKLLVPKASTPFLQPDDEAVLVPETKTLWYVHGARLFKVDAEKPGADPVRVLTAKHKLAGLARAGDGLVVHTSHAVLKLGPTGKVERSIPVEGRRQLARSFVAPEVHAYLFSDHLLEVYRVAGKRSERYRLPLDDGEKAEGLELAKARLALLVDGHPRVFHLREALAKSAGAPLRSSEK